ncbi:hypothetical protein SDC9_187556 [bioreactor metagenome]|uniref:Uncharacterized protein n=1 Tax=bioreactor metagenome TaxID=1076179 RepID=A0A645HLW9_9ZZZZ
MKELVKEAEAFSENFSKMHLSYYIVKKAFGMYGIEIENETKHGLEHASFKNISSDKKFVCFLVKKLADGLVTPVTLSDVTEDLIKQFG